MSQKKNPSRGQPAGAEFGMRVSTECGLSNLRNQAEQRLRREHLARRVHQLGARALFEFIEELDRDHGLGDDLDRRLERYAAVDRDLLAAVDGDLFPPSPLRLVGGAR
jgi:hypothetical protein